MLPSQAAAAQSPAQPYMVADDASGSDCGTIQLSGATTDASALKAAANCFSKAFSLCTTAQLHATWTDSDGTIDRVFVVTPGEASCNLADMVTHGTATSGSQTSATYRCAGVTSDGTTLTIRGCGADGDVKLTMAG
jgi:hypothetical protein